MATFRGVIQGNRGEASRLGNRTLRTEAQSWSGKITVELFQRDGRDMCEIYLDSHGQTEVNCLIYAGPVASIPHQMAQRRNHVEMARVLRDATANS